MKNKNIDVIVRELLEYDPSLHSQEKEVRAIVKKLLKTKPNTNFSYSFAKQLKKELLTNTNMQKSKNKKENAIADAVPTWLGFAVASLIIIIAAPIALIFVTQTTPQLATIPGEPKIALLDNQITQRESQAFGSLFTKNIETPEITAGFGAGDLAELPIRLQGGGGMQDVSSSIAPVPPFEPTQVTYAYSGELKIPENASVYKHAHTGELDRGLASIFSGSISSNLINLQSFSNLGLRSVTLAEQTPQGLEITYDGNTDSFNIYQNWQEWQTSHEQRQLTENDIPTDDRLIHIANTFLSEHGILTSPYGEPLVLRPWQNMPVEPGIVTRYIPQHVSVLYPLQVEGVTVYEEYGAPYGIYVNIDIIENKVAGVSNISAHNYEKSAYPLLTDASRLQDMIERGGPYGYIDENAKNEVTVTLGDPEIILTRFWRYQDNNSEEFFIPALRFPVTEQPEDLQYFYRKNVIIPLVADFIESHEPPIGIPEPLPLEKDTAAESVPADTPKIEIAE